MKAIPYTMAAQAAGPEGLPLPPLDSGELLHRLGRTAGARAELAQPWELADSELDRAFLAKRLQELADLG